MQEPQPLISAEALRLRMKNPQQLVLLDCSFDLADIQTGETAFAVAHLPGARYAHLERDLSGSKSERGPLDGGRHPLPTREALSTRMGVWGITPSTLAVVYDAQGSTYAARAWWLLRWMGHYQVVVLDGGLAAWQAAGGELEVGPTSATAQAPTYPLMASAMPIVCATELLPPQGHRIVVDARAPERFRGEVEPLDDQAGHIPGARNRFFKDNLAADGRFLSPAELRAAFAALGAAPRDMVHQCGSGVTACHNLLAMAVAGLHGASLYPGSWSEWSADPERPVARN